MLQVHNIEVKYSNVILALRGVTLEVGERAIVGLLGANGAGKSTTLKSISGLLKPELGEVTDGSIQFKGVRIEKKRADEIVRIGIIQAIEGRKLCEHLTTEENILSGSLALSGGSHIKNDLEKVYDYFPKLRELRRNIPGYLSGGEQQMVVIGRTMMAHPQVMLLDEPSLGLAPMMVSAILEVIKRINDEEGAAVLLVEQNAKAALAMVDYGYVMETGRSVLDGPADKIRENEDIKEFYLGLSQLDERKSYREVKHYKRRKRWL